MNTTCLLYTSEHKSHPVRNAILGLLVLILVASAVVSYPIGKEYFQEKSVAGKDIEITIEKGSTSRDVSAILKKKGIIRYEAAFLLKLYFSDYKLSLIHISTIIVVICFMFTVLFFLLGIIGEYLSVILGEIRKMCIRDRNISEAAVMRDE